MTTAHASIPDTHLRAPIAAARRLVVKIGSSSLASVAGGIDADRIDALVDVLAAARHAGRQVVLVSSGAIAAGLAPLGLSVRPRDVATQQASASVGQMLLVSRYASSFARHGLTVGQVLLTAEDVIRRAHYRNALRTFERLLDLGVIPIVNENDTVATGEIQFGDNDRLAALTAHLVKADALVLLSDVDGVYTAKPGTPGAALITDVRSADDIAAADTSRAGSGVGSGGMASKITAAGLAAGAGVHAVVTAAALAKSALAGEHVGTYFHPADQRPPARALWLRHAAHVRGSIFLDAGAVAAVTSRNASLLAAGITAVAGEFSAGDPVDLVGPDGATIGRGLVAFDADELAAVLGQSYLQREVVHRDDLALL